MNRVWQVSSKRPIDIQFKRKFTREGRSWTVCPRSTTPFGILLVEHHVRSSDGWCTRVSKLILRESGPAGQPDLETCSIHISVSPCRAYSEIMKLKAQGVAVSASSTRVGWSWTASPVVYTSWHISRTGFCERSVC